MSNEKIDKNFTSKQEIKLLLFKLFKVIIFYLPAVRKFACMPQPLCHENQLAFNNAGRSAKKKFKIPPAAPVRIQFCSVIPLSAR